MAGEWMCLLATATFWMTGSMAYSPGSRASMWRTACSPASGGRGPPWGPGGSAGAPGGPPGGRVGRSAVVARRQIGGAHDRERRGQQHVLHGGPGGQLVMGAGDDVLRRRLL